MLLLVANMAKRRGKRPPRRIEASSQITWRLDGLTLQAIVGVILAVVYGVLTALAGTLQFRNRQIQPWSAALMVLSGLVLLLVSLMWARSWALYALVAGLLAIHLAAINNGLRLHGKITPSHHLVRLALSVLLIVLWFVR